jgi:putative transposase
MTEKIIKTLQVRVKDKHAALLTAMARNVNFVWNYCAETCEKAIRDRAEFLSAYELHKLTAGYSRCEGVLIGACTVNRICTEYATRRKQYRRVRLNWRVSNPASSRRSLGWIPFKGESVRYKAGQIVFGGHRFSLWDSYGLSGYELRSGSFAQDARGRWYFNVAVEIAVTKSEGFKAIGIDLGLKTAVTTSDGQKFTGRLYRASEAKLAKAQRANKKRLARTVHAKIRNQRKDGLHKFSTALVKENAAIFVGDVSSKKMLKTKMAKSTQDAGWAMFKTMLENKCRQAGVVFEVVNEAWSTQTCNVCGVIAGPKGRAGLNKRVWACACGAVHDRDVNAALNIRRAGLRTLEEGAVA